jgi:UDP-N-acetylmuramyl tripeptide synthase
MQFLDARRLTGPNLFLDGPGTVLDVRCTAEEGGRLLPLWEQYSRRMLDAAGWQREVIRARRFPAGVSMAFSAPIDALYAATDMNLWAWQSCESRLENTDPPDFAAALEEFRQAIAREANPGLLELGCAAADHEVAFLHDDDYASVGLGSGSRTWPVREIPDVSAIDWDTIHDVPVALVTGTNGKTTTVRLAAHIGRSAGLKVGLSSTDWTAIDGAVLERGDFAGPGGARSVLRHPATELAVLESARGGLLRRGLAVTRADAALITNIAEDHLGDFGSQSLEELLEIKWIVSRAVAASGALILNADDSLLEQRAAGYPGRIVWFGLNEGNRVIGTHVAAGGTAFVLADERLLRIDAEAREAICSIQDVPLALAGAARHNLSNALAAAALTWCLGVALPVIGRGLTSMSQDSNPGRCNVFRIAGVNILVDFAHNPHGMRALLDMARALPGKRRLLAFSQAGDRPDEAIRELARSGWSIGLDTVIVSELRAYARGRSGGEVYGIIRSELLKLGARPDQIRHFEEEAESLDAALAWAEPGDLIILLVLGDIHTILDRLRALAKH